MVEVGLGIMREEKIRAYGIDTPELRGVERDSGLIVRDSVRSWILGKEVSLETIKDSRGKYGRLLGVIHNENGVNINNKLVEKGMAEVNYYK